MATVPVCIDVVPQGSQRGPWISRAPQAQPCSDSPTPYIAEELPETCPTRGLLECGPELPNFNSGARPRIPKDHSRCRSQHGRHAVGLCRTCGGLVTAMQVLEYKIVRRIRRAPRNLCMLKYWPLGTPNKQIGNHAQCLRVLGKPAAKMSPRLKLANSGRVLAQVAPMPQYGLIGETRACTHRACVQV